MGMDEQPNSATILQSNWLTLQRLMESFGKQSLKTEADFSYQYDYNRQLVEEAAELHKQASDCENRLTVKTAALQAIRSERDNYHALWNDLATRVDAEEKKRAQPSSRWRKIAITCLVAWVLTAGALTYEKSVGPLENLGSQVRMMLSDLTVQTGYEQEKK